MKARVWLGAALAGVALTGCASQGAQPVPGPTVTVTETASASPAPTVTESVTVTVAPDSCKQLAELTPELYVQVDKFTKLSGDTVTAQNRAVQGIMQNDITILNSSRQLMIDIRNETISQLVAIEDLRTTLAGLSEACRKDSQ